MNFRSSILTSVTTVTRTCILSWSTPLTLQIPCVIFKTSERKEYFQFINRQDYLQGLGMNTFLFLYDLIMRALCMNTAFEDEIGRNVVKYGFVMMHLNGRYRGNDKQTLKGGRNLIWSAGRFHGHGMLL